MPARKNVGKGKGRSGRSDSSAPELVVVLEDMRSQFKVFGEALQGVNDKVDRLDGDVASGFERVDRELGLVKAVVIDHSRELREIRGRLEAAMERKVDWDEVEAVVERVLARPRAR